MIALYFWLMEPWQQVFLVLVTMLIGIGITWRISGLRSTRAWIEISERATTNQTHPYRDPLRQTDVHRRQPLVQMAIFAQGALYPAIFGWFLIFAYSFYARALWAAALALGLGMISLAMVRKTKVLLENGPESIAEIRRPLLFRALLGLAMHAGLATVLVATSFGIFDDVVYETRGLKGMEGFDTLGEILAILPSKPIFLLVDSFSAVIWHSLAIVAIVYAFMATVHAVLVLKLLHAAHNRFPDLRPWFRKWFGLGIVSVVGLWSGLGLQMQSWAKPKGADIYASIQPPCALPPLPADAMQVLGVQHIYLMSEDATVRFKLADSQAYKRAIKAAWYGKSVPAHIQEVLEPSEWLENVQAYSRRRNFNFKAYSHCGVEFDSERGIVVVTMSGLD